MEKYKVTLTVEERQALDRMVSCKAAARKLIHAREFRGHHTYFLRIR